MKISRRSIPVFLLTLLLSIQWTACGSSDKEKSKHLPDDKMEAVLTDIYLAEAYASSIPVDSTLKPKPPKNLDSLALFYTVILDKHKISYDDFAKSMDWYRNNPGQLDSIYRHMQLHVEHMKDKLLQH